jgi:hypothetical protein
MAFSTPTPPAEIVALASPPLVGISLSLTPFTAAVIILVFG